MNTRSEGVSGAQCAQERCWRIDQIKPHQQYTGRLSLDQTADMILQGAGQRGPCLDYLENTVRHLEALGMGGGSLKELLDHIKRRGEGAG